jgi:prepilin peptidase CpaA
MALTDFRHYKIRNEFILILIALFAVYAIVSGHLSTVYWNVGLALVVLVALLYAYSLDQVGGGDLKLLAVAFLWTGPWTAAPFVILLTIFICLHYLAARFGWVPVQQSAIGQRIPLAPAVAAALIGTFVLGYIAV